MIGKRRQEGYLLIDNRNNSNLLYLFTSVQIEGHTGAVEYTLTTLSNGNLVLRAPGGDIPLVASVNQDPIH